MADGRLSLTSDELRTTLRIERGEGVPEHVWYRLRVELQPLRRATSSLLEADVHRFLARTILLQGILKRSRIGLDVDKHTRELLMRRQDEVHTVRKIQEDEPLLSTDEVAQRLVGTRFVRTLRDFQVANIRQLLALPHGANFSVPGAGKTCVTYALYEAERAVGRVERMLVVAPLSAFESWRNEAEASLSPAPVIHAFDNTIPHDAEVVLTGYQRLHLRYEYLAEWVSRGRTHVILDEAHRMKRGREGQWGDTCLNLSYLASRRDILTGTPAPQHPTDLEALFEYVWPSQGRYLIPEAVRSDPPPPGAGALIADRIGPLFVRTRKSQLGLPAPQYDVIPVRMGDLQRDIYHALRQRYTGLHRLGHAGRVDMARMGRIVMYLLEAATNPALLVAGSGAGDHSPFRHPPLEIPAGSALPDLLDGYPDYETPAKFQQLGELIRRNAEAGRKTLVWSNFVRNIQTLRGDLARYQPAVVYGAIPSEVSRSGADETREDQIDRFRRDPDCMVLLANPAATSEGVSLHDICHDAIYLERTFNAGQYLQSVDRIHRLGLDADAETHITFLVSEGTIDDVVHRRVDEKARRLGNMLEDPDIVTMSLPDEDDLGRAVETEDLEALFAHLRGQAHVATS